MVVDNGGPFHFNSQINTSSCLGDRSLVFRRTLVVFISVFLSVLAAWSVKAQSDNDHLVAARRFLDAYNPWKLVDGEFAEKAKTDETQKEILRYIKKYPLRRLGEERLVKNFSISKLAALEDLALSSTDRANLDNFLFLMSDIKTKLLVQKQQGRSFFFDNDRAFPRVQSKPDQVNVLLEKIGLDEFIDKLIERWISCLRSPQLRMKPLFPGGPSYFCPREKTAEGAIDAYDFPRRRSEVRSFVASVISRYFDESGLNAVTTFFSRTDGWHVISKYEDFYGAMNALSRQAITIGQNKWRADQPPRPPPVPSTPNMEIYRKAGSETHEAIRVFLNKYKPWRWAERQIAHSEEDKMRQRDWLASSQKYPLEEYAKNLLAHYKPDELSALTNIAIDLEDQTTLDKLALVWADFDELIFGNLLSRRLSSLRQAIKNGALPSSQGTSWQNAEKFMDRSNFGGMLDLVIEEQIACYRRGNGVMESKSLRRTVKCPRKRTVGAEAAIKARDFPTFRSLVHLHVRSSFLSNFSDVELERLATVLSGLDQWIAISRFHYFARGISRYSGRCVERGKYDWLKGNATSGTPVKSVD